MTEQINTTEQIKTTEELFWEQRTGKAKPTQMDRYVENNSPEQILNFIRLNGGAKMGTTLEEYARYKFSPVLEKRDKGKNNTGYDQKVTVSETTVFVEQKSSGHWVKDDFRWQHVEPNHKWNVLLLCGIGYQEVKFWLMNRLTFNQLVDAGKITNQGNKEKESSEGMWFNYSDVWESLVRVNTSEDIIQFVSSFVGESVSAN